MKVRRHEEEFDGGMHAWCGRGDTAVLPEQFEATTYKSPCDKCGLQIEVSTQPYTCPEFYMVVFVRCQCGGAAKFELPVN